MQNHRVHDVSVMPGVTFLDIIYRILAAQGLDCARAELRGILFPEAIATREGLDREIRVALSEGADGAWRVEASSRSVENGQPHAAWRENLRCALVFCDQPALPQIDVAALKSTAVRVRDMDELYAEARAEGIRHGAPMMCQGPVYQGREELLAELRPSETSFALDDRFYLHPAKLDASTIAAFAHTAICAGEPFIPVFMERFRAPARTDGICHVYVRRPASRAPSGDVVRVDYLLCDERGRVLASVDNLTCKRIRFPGLITRLLEDVAAPQADATPKHANGETSFDASQTITRRLCQLAGRFLGKPPSEIKTDVGFYDMGLDSVSMLQISRELESVVGAPLYPTLLFEFTDIESLARHLAGKYGVSETAGGSDTAAVPPAAPESAGAGELACYCESWVPAESVAIAQSSGDVVLFGGADDTRQALARALVAHGRRAIEVMPGSRFQALGDDRFSLDIGDREQLGQFLKAAARAKASPRTFVHLPLPDDPSLDCERISQSFFALWATAAALIDQKPEQPCNLYAISAGHGADIPPRCAPLAAAARTIAEETPVLRCRSIAIDRLRDAEGLCRGILAEEADASREAEVHYHTHRRSVRRYVRYAPSEAASQVPASRTAALKQGGVYLLAGGGGGIGVLLADHLLRSFAARLVLLGRSPVSPALQARLDDWTRSGGEVQYVRADISRRDQAEAALARTRESFGRLDGIFHLAGVNRDAVFFRKRRADMEETFAAKLGGAFNLDAASRSDELDFFVLFSSLATLGNQGQCDYAFANAALESFADWRARRHDRPGKTLAIGWPLWADGGMRPAPQAVERARDSGGLWPMPAAAALRVLEEGLVGPQNRFVVAYGDRARFEPMLAPPAPAAHEATDGPPPAAPADTGDIAIIGLAGQYPQAADLDEFWRNLASGRDCITEVPDRWDHARWFDPERGRDGKSYGRWGGFLAGVDRFDPAFFGISRKEAEGMDPQERLFLKTAWKTLEDAGYTPKALAGEAVGVFVGVMWSHYQLFDDDGGGAAPTALHAAVANRVSYCLDFHGPSLAVDTACSSSLTALVLAVDSLRRGDCSVALAGGVNVTIHPQKYLQLARGQFLSDDGRCRSFGDGGTGYVPGEGVGAVLLKPLARARADGDLVHGVIKGAFLNHTGRTSGFTVPSPTSQAALIRTAIERANMDPRSIGYIEAHGTGTALGDPIEIEGLRQAFAGVGLEPGHCAIGSVKSNIGHLESAAGIAGVTKVLLQMKHRQLAPSLHAGTPNRHIAFDSAPVRLQRDLAPWSSGGGPLRAGISSFGAGGANAHVLLESAESERPASDWRGPCLLVLSVRDAATLRSYAASLESFLAQASGQGAARDHGEVRAFLVGRVAELLAVPVDAVDPAESFDALGIDASSLAGLARQLDERFAGVAARIGISVDVTLDALARACEGLAPSTPSALLALDDIAYTLQVGRVALAERLAIVAGDLDAARSSLRAFVQGTAPAADCCWGSVAEGGGAARPPDAWVSLFRAGRLRELAADWVKGADVPWRSCYPREGKARPPRRVSLPTYPFREESYWVGQWQASRSAPPARAPAAPDGGSAVRAADARAANAPAAKRANGSAGLAQSELELRILDGVALVVMQDGANSNMFAAGLVARLEAAFAEIAARPEIKALVVAGSDDVFSMGATPQALERLAGKQGRFTDVPFLYQGMLHCPVPVIAAMQGHASGGGLIFGLHADIVVMAREAVYSANFLKYGFTPGMGATYVLEQRFGRSLATEMFFTGRSLTGEELERRGGQVTFRPQGEVLSTALDLARSIADKPVAAIRALKQELSGRVLEKLPEIIAREVDMHDRVLGDEARKLVGARFDKLARAGRGPGQAAPATAGNGLDHAPASAVRPAPDGVGAARLGDPAASGGRREEAVAAIEDAVCAHLYLHRHEIDRRLSFSDMGVDSIGAVKIVRDLNRHFDLDMDSVVVYDYPTVPQLADQVVNVLGEAHAFHAGATDGLRPGADQDKRAEARIEAAVVLKPLAGGGGAAAALRNGSAAALAARPQAIVLKPAADISSTRGQGPETRTPPARAAGIAVIGMSGRFPDAPDLATLWTNLSAGRSSVREVPPERWDVARIFDPDIHAPDKTTSKWAAFLDDVDLFDSAFFNLSPFEAELMDPEQRLFLEEAWKGLEDAGYAVGSARGTRCGVFVGCAPGDYVNLLAAAGKADTGQAFLGNSASVLAARIGYFLNLNGPTVAVDTACSSSLVAVHLACESIRSGECEMAVAGGVALMLTPQLQIRTSKMGILSPTGRCAPFDASADGIVLGEGVGVVVLKALNRALEDGDNICGVIRGSGINGDGKTNGITAPSALSQEDLLARVHARAGVGAGEIGYVETHGTGTALGDPIEFKALKNVFQRSAPRARCGIGSIKSNLGHTTMAAGIAGLLKVLLAVRHGRLPPSMNFETANPKIELAGGPFFVVTRLSDWQPGPSGARIAAVSSFGFSGTNCHVVVGEAPARPPMAKSAGADCVLVPVSAHTEAALARRLTQLAESLTAEHDLRDVAFTLGVGRCHLPRRTALVVSSIDDLRHRLRALADGARPEGCVHHASLGADASGRPADSFDALVPNVLAAPDSSAREQALLALAEAYVRGHDPDWPALYRQAPGRRISLPAYPFERARHWVDAPAGAGSAAPRTSPPHALPADTRAVRDAVLVRNIRPDDWMVADHRVGGVRIVPATAGLAMAAAAAATRGMTLPLRLSQVQWLRPIAAELPLGLRLVLRDRGGEMSFELAEDGGGETGSLALRGVIAPLGPAAEPERLDVAAIMSRCGRRMPRADCYASFDAAGIGYGPAFQLVDEIAVGGDEAIGRLIAPPCAVDEEGVLTLHPAVLDGALQVAAALEAQSAGGPALPFALESLDVHRLPTGPAFSHVKREDDRRFSMTLTDLAGQVCLRCRGFTLRAPKAEAESMIFVPTWREAAALLSRAPGHDAAGRVMIVHAAAAEPIARALHARLAESAAVVLPWDEALSALERSDPRYETLYVLTGVPASENAEDATLAAFGLVKALISGGRLRQRLDLRIVVSATVAIAADDPVQPGSAGLLGLAQAVAAEYPLCSVQCIDLASDASAPDEIAQRLLSEMPAQQLVAIRGNRRFVRGFRPARLPATAAPFKARGSYLMLGGAGGIGMALSRELARTAQARVSWIGRRPLDPAIARQIDEIGSLGGQAIYLQADAADEGALRGAVAEARRRFGRIDGAFHSALVLSDKTLANMNEGILREALAPKCAGAVKFARALENENLDFMVLFSSAASFLPSGGQANYAAASTFEDALALSLRRSCRFPVSVINWGYWGSVGAVATASYRRRFEAMGIGSIEPAEGFAALARLLANDVPQALVIKAAPYQLAALGVDLGIGASAGPGAIAVPDRGGDLARSRAGFARLDLLARHLLLRQLQRHAILAGLGTRMPIAQLQERAGVVPHQQNLFAALLAMLQSAGVLSIADGDVTVVEKAPSPEACDAADMVRQFPDLAPHIRLLESCVEALLEVLGGRKQPLDVLFPKGSMSLVEPVYKGQPGADYYHGLLAAQAASAVSAVAKEGRVPRILEVGAGTGAATSFVLEACAAAGLTPDYWYTDISPSFLRHGERAFAASRATMLFRTLDIEREPDQQGLEAGSFDIVIAANVLHATRAIDRTLARIHRLLRPGGVALINEVTRRFDFLTLTFGLTPGWWLFEDAGNRIAHAPLLGPRQWRDALGRARFRSVRTMGMPGTVADDLEQCLFAAEKAAIPAAADSGLEQRTRFYVKQIFAEILKLRPADLLERETFEAFGVDSLVGMNIVHRLEQDLGSLPSTLLFEHLTIEELARHLAGRCRARLIELLGADAPAPSIAHAPRAPAKAAAGPEPDAPVPARGAQAGAAMDIAIVGVGGRYPGAADLDAFWANLAAGVSSVREIPPERWDWREQFDPRRGQPHKTYSRWGGFLDGVDLFDPLFFNILPRDAQKIDPQERLFLETCWNLLEEAGCLGEHTHEPHTGVFVGTMYGSYGQLGATRWARGELAGPHSAYWSIANRVSYFFDFDGPSFAVDSACSSSLTAVHLACESIRRGECRMAIAGGVNVILHPAHFAALSSLNMLSDDGGCKVFDAGANGIVPGEGVGAVLLKPLHQAVADGDTIWGVVKGSFVNAGGKTGGYTVPNPQAQAGLVAEAWRRAGIDPRTVSYVEAHGTGTELGDPIEIKGLTTAFSATNADRHYCAVGSVKANIGHLEGAAGIAGLTKVLLQLRHGKLAPCIRVSALNPKIDFESTPFYPPLQLTEWDRPRVSIGGEDHTCPRRAGISSFGAGGANVHLAIEEYRGAGQVQAEDQVAAAEEAEQLFILSARTPQQLQAYAGKVAAFLSSPQAHAVSLAGLAYGSQVGRRAMVERLAVVARSKAALAEHLAAFSRTGRSTDVLLGSLRANAGGEDLLFDDDGDGFIQSLIASRKLAKLARAWLLGLRIDWRLLWPDPKPRLVPFPTYPFERKSCWFAAREPDPRVAEPQMQDDAERVLDEAAFFMTDHRVGGARWVPGAALLQLACAAAGQDAACRLREVRWPAPLNVDEHPPRLRIRLARDGDEIRFRLTAPDDAGTCFASGMLSAAVTAGGGRVDLDAIRARCADVRDVAAFYRSLERSGLDYGPSLRVVEQLRVGEGEVLARLMLPSGLGRDGDAFIALLDGAMQSVAGLFDGSTRYLPVGLSQLARRGALPPQCWVYAREAMPSAFADGARGFDLDLIDDDGLVRLSVERLQIVPSRAAPAVIDYRRPVWSRNPLTGETRAARTMLILSDDDAFVRALMARHASAGTRFITVSTGKAYEDLGDFRYRIVPGEPAHFRRLADELDGRGMLPDAVVHLCPAQPFTAEPAALSALLDRGFRSQLWLTVAILGRRSETPLRVVFAYADDGSEPQPHLAAVVATLKTLAQKHMRLSALHVALADRETAADGVAARLSEELLHCAAGVSEVRYQGGERWTRSLEPFDPGGDAAGGEMLLHADGAYLITGGAGALGLRFARFLAEQRPVRIVLAGRSPLGDAQRARIEHLAQSGAAVAYVQADVERRSDVDRLIADIKARHGALRGVIHAAGTHRDALATRKTSADVDAVLGPKVLGTLNLDAATSEEPLDFFVLFSSVVAESGNAGQADYAFSNAFMDRFAELRAQWVRAGRRDGKTLSIDWPLWAEGGMTVDPATRELFARKWGMVPLNTQSGLQAFRIGLRGPDSCFTVVERAARESLPGRPAAAVEIAAPELPPGDDLAEVENSLRGMAAAFLLVPEEDVEMQVDLLETGFDSISLTELINQVNALYGLDLLPTELFECATLSAFARHLADRHKSAVAARHALRRAPDLEASAPAPAPASPRRIDGVAQTAAAPQPLPARPRSQDIAIVGIAGRFPQCEDLAAFWAHLIAGDDLVSTVPEDRADLRNNPATRDVRGGFLADVACFDARFFGISPQEAALMDPQQRLFMETVWAAIQDAGYQPIELSGSATGLFVGVGTSDYGDLLRGHGIEVEAHTATGIAHSILANRISHRLDLKGPSEAVDTACSSSLVALHHAVRAIRAGECDAAIAGGVNVILSPALFTAFFKSGMLSPDGRCKSFDAAADGYVRGEGAGAVLLKSLERALRDGDHIHAVIKGSAVNHCGRTPSLTAPSPEGQAQVLLQAWLDAGIDPRALSCIEAHGTGTKLGDPIEIEGMKKALAELYRRRGEPVPVEPHICVGSVKTNIGHLEAAAGIAGVVKLVLSMRHGQLPPSLHFKTPNPHLRLEGSPLRIDGHRRDWPGIADGDGRRVRCVGISSFGFGGTNAHVVLQDYRPPSEREPSHSAGPWLVPLSAPDGDALVAYAARLARALRDDPSIDIAAVAHTLQIGRQPFAHRLAIVAADRDQLLAALDQAARASDPGSGLYRGIAGEHVASAGEETDLARLATLWVKGAVVDWQRLWPRKPPRASLPTFPLARTRHWFERTPARAPAARTEPSSTADAAPAPVGKARRIKRKLEPTSVAAPAHAAVPQPGSAADAPRQPPSPGSAAELIKARLSAILGIVPAEIPEDRPFFDLGLDSIYGMELVRLLNASFHLELKASELYDYDTIAKLSAFVTAQTTDEAAPAREEQRMPADTAPAAAALAGVEELCGQALTSILGWTIDPQRSFADNGLSSFDMLRAVNVLEGRFGTLRKALLFEHPTLSALAAYLRATHGADAVTKLKALSEAPLARELVSEPRELAGDASIIIRKSELAGAPQIAAVVAKLQERHEKESGLAGRDIAPLIFLGASRQGYFNITQHRQNLLAFSYVGDEDYLPRLTAEFVEHARRSGLKSNLLSVIRLETVAGMPFTATPFGAIQRLDELDGFSLDGKDMRRLRYMVRKFERSGDCRTVEYRSGADASVDGQVAALVDAWCETKQMTNPYVAVVREELRHGRLAAKHRMFLTYCGDTLSNTVIVTKLPSENGHLLDLEFYPADMPLGGLEFAIVNIIEKLRAEGSAMFSLGASFGVKICDSPNADAAAERALDELRTFGLFDGSGNFQFKNKFRPVNIPLFLCRPAEPDATDVSDIILMIANPVVPEVVPLPVRSRLADEARPVEGRDTQPAIATTEAQREQLLKSHGFNVLRFPSRAIEFDLVTDSWTELDKSFVRARMGQLHARQTAAGTVPDLAAQTALPFDCVVPAMSGRAAEMLLCRAWPRRDGIVLHNSLFPSWGPSLAASGFTPALIGRAAEARGDGGAPFKGDLDAAALEHLLARHAGSVRFIGIELGSNAIGGYPISLANLRQVRDLAHGVPLVFDATRIIENACFIAAHEDGCRGREPWDIVREILSLADSVTLSLSKDYGIDFGGIVASRDPELAANLREAIERHGPLANLACRGMIAHVLDDREHVVAAVRQRMDCVRLLWEALVEAGAPVLRPAAGHCVLLDVARLRPFAGFDHPRQAFLAWMFRRTGIRAAPHLAGLGNDPGVRDCVRLAVPLGLERADIATIAARLGALLREPGPASDLVAVGDQASSEAAMTYYPVDRLPRDIADDLRTRAPSASDNERLLREHCPAVERRLVRLAEGDVELFSAGQGPTLLLMHGFNIGAGLFAGQFKAMTDRYRLLVIHHPGVGATTAARGLSLEGLGRLFMEVLRQQDVAGPIHVLGTSFGGLTAQNFVLQYPDYVSSLTLVSSSYKAGNRAGQINRLTTVVEQDFDHLIKHSKSERLMRERGRLEALLLRCESMDPQIGLRYLDEFAANPDFLSRLSGLRKPTLVVQGRYDTVINEETALRLRGAIAGAEYAEISDAGHFPYLTSTDAFNRVLLDFLARHDSPVRSAEVHDFHRPSQQLKKPRK